MASKKAAENDEGVVFIFPADDAKKSLLETGAYVRDDASAGHRIDDFINIKEFPLRKVEGLDFCAQNSFYDETMRDVIESSINRPYWGLAKIYNSAVLPSNTANFFMTGPTMRAVCIVLFTPNTQLILFEGSHNKRVPGKVMSKFGLLTLPHDMLEIEGIKRAEYHLKQGGFAFIDGRTGWTILKGDRALGRA